MVDDRVLIFVGKGGSGKSTTCVIGTGTAIFEGRDLRVASADPANATMPRFCPDVLPEDSPLIFNSNEPTDIVPWLEEEVFGPDVKIPTVIDAGANMEGLILEWLQGRGISETPRIRFVVPIDCKDALSAADRIFANAGRAPVLLLENQYGGRNAAAATSHPFYEDIIARGAKTASLPRFGSTLEDMHRRSLRPDIMARDPNRFAAHGAVSLMRQFQEAFAHVPEFRP